MEPWLSLLPPLHTGTFWPHKWDLTPPLPDEPVLSITGQRWQHLPRKHLAQRWLTGLEATRKTTAKSRKSPEVLSSSFRAKPPRRVTASVPGEKFLRGLDNLSLLTTSGSYQRDLEEISTCLQHCWGRIFPRKEKSPSCYPARCTERKGKRKAVSY